MSQPANSKENIAITGGWAPEDYSDGREALQWTSGYPSGAKKQIYLEATYLVAWTAIYIAVVFILLYKLCYGKIDLSTNLQQGDATVLNPAKFVGFSSAWIGGSLGGFSFGIKWMYHIVAKQLWHEDRRLWRLLTPHLSGVVSLFMVFIVSGGLLQVFHRNFVERPICVLAFSFLVGYFSDKALAKMAEVADTLFGVTEKHNKKKA